MNMPRTENKYFCLVMLLIVILSTQYAVVSAEDVLEERAVVVAFKSGVSTDDITPASKGVAQAGEARAFIESRFSELEPVFPAISHDTKKLAAANHLPDLSRWYQFRTTDADPTHLLESIRELPGVEYVFLRGKVRPAIFSSGKAAIATGTPTFFKDQAYLESAPGGNGVRDVWKKYKLKGRGVTIADIEGDWLANHHDLKTSKSANISGIRAGSSLWYEHGTAELGLVVATRNKYGVTGIAHKANPRMFSIFIEGNNGQSVDNVADAIIRATENLKAGDIIYLPIEYSEDFSSNRGFAVEYYPDVFEAILTATYKGIVVIEAAGNGGMNLDSSLFHGRFKLGVAGDSGAILVGAGGNPDFCNLKRMNFSNFGSRLDVQNWGTGVVTTGYGDLYRKTQTKSYTDSFDGTSSATGITAGVCALMQEFAKKTIDRPLTPYELRKILKETGTPQRGNAEGQNIGPRPDLVKALEAIEEMD